MSNGSVKEACLVLDLLRYCAACLPPSELRLTRSWPSIFSEPAPILHRLAASRISGLLPMAIQAQLRRCRRSKPYS